MTGLWLQHKKNLLCKSVAEGHMYTTAVGLENLPFGIYSLFNDVGLAANTHNTLSEPAEVQVRKRQNGET